MEGLLTVLVTLHVMPLPNTLLWLRPATDTCGDSDWASPWRGIAVARPNWLPFIGVGIWDILAHRVSDGWKEQSVSFIPLKGLREWEGSRAPGVRKTFVVFFRFFHLARRFWNQTCSKEE